MRVENQKSVGELLNKLFSFIVTVENQKIELHFLYGYRRHGGWSINFVRKFLAYSVEDKCRVVIACEKVSYEVYPLAKSEK